MPQSGRMSWRPTIFLSGQAVSLLGNGLAGLAIPVLVLELTRDPLMTSISAASVTVGYLLVGLPAGVLIDRLDALRLLIAVDLARTGLFALLYLSSLAGRMNVWVILGVALLAGAGQVFFETAIVVVIRDLFATSALIRVNARLELATRAALVLGSAAVGVLAAGQLPVAMLVNAVTFAVSTASLLVVRRRRAADRGRITLSIHRLAGDLVAGIRYLASMRLLVILTTMQIVVNFCLAVEKLLVFYARDTLGLPLFHVGLVVAAGGAGGMVGALTAPWFARFGQVRVVTAAIVGTGVAIGSVALAGSAVTLGLAHFLYIWVLIVASLVNRTLRQSIVPRSLLARVTGTVRVLFLAVDPLGVVVAGALTVWLGDPRLIFAGAGLIVIVAGIVGWLSGLRAFRGAAVEDLARASHQEQPPIGAENR